MAFHPQKSLIIDNYDSLAQFQIYHQYPLLLMGLFWLPPRRPDPVAGTVLRLNLSMV